MNAHTPTPWTMQPYEAEYTVSKILAPDHQRQRFNELKARGLAAFRAISIGTAAGQVAIIPLDESSRENGAFIVRSVNCHAALMTVCNQAFEALAEINSPLASAAREAIRAVRRIAQQDDSYSVQPTLSQHITVQVETRALLDLIDDLKGQSSCIDEDIMESEAYRNLRAILPYDQNDTGNPTA